jgi:protein O-GlcNAc transferase
VNRPERRARQAGRVRRAAPAAASLDMRLREGVRHHRDGRLSEAAASYREVLRGVPGHPDALHLLGLVAYQTGDQDRALDLIEQALARRPDLADAHNNLGTVLRARGQREAAIASFERAVALAPRSVEACSNLGTALAEAGRAAEAVPVLERAVALRPDLADVHNNLGVARRATGELEAAIASFARALDLRPEFALARTNLADAQVACGNAGRAAGRLGAAIEALHAAVELRPESAAAWSDLGYALTTRGRLPEALAAFERALALAPDPRIHSNLIFTLDLDPEATRARVFAERRRWNERHAVPLAPAVVAHANDPDPDRRLRVGYVSADFRSHSAASVLAPVLLSHDPALIEVVCYADVSRPDEVTERFQAAAEWRPTVGWSDEAVADQVRADRIDVLVDLTGHSAGNRLLVFARRPAPVQVTAWGYAVGTGLDAMDYFFGDPVTVPPEARAHFSEEIVHLPSIVCFEPPAGAPAVTALPALARGAVTFGCFNRLAKLSAPALDVWAEILKAVPGARLRLKFTGLDEPVTQADMRAAFAGRGVDPGRLEFAGRSARAEHLAAYADVDIALDPFPHGGGVTALEGLWMGVPMMTLAGDRVAGLLGPSFLTTLGLTGWIARTPAEYVERAVAHAADLAALARLRASLRARLSASPLGDAAGYCRAVEAAYRTMWRRWCAGAARC